MISAAPTIVAIETNSAWVVILAVSLVTLPLALLLRKVIDRPGAFASSVLLGLPLVLPLIAAMAFQRSVLPEVSVLRPLSPGAVTGADWNVLHFLFVRDGSGKGLVPYVFSGGPGKWLLLVGLSFSTFMVLRRLAGAIGLQRLLRRCTEPLRADHEPLMERLEDLGWRAGLRKIPPLLLLPDDVQGAFVIGGKTPRILISPALVKALTDDELDGILAHEVAHVVARDVPVTVVAGLLRDLVAWNPMAHVALRRLVAQREFEADRCAARLTGKPLAVASSLLKMCELIGRPPRRSIRAAAFFGRRTPLKRRVANLLALADGRMSAREPGGLPYLLAAAVAMVVGLQAGAQVAQQSDFAIVWDGHTSTSVPLWSVGSADRRSTPADNKKKSSGRKATARSMTASAASVSFQDGYALRERDINRWVHAMAKSQNLPRKLFASEVGRGWEAIPVFQQSSFGRFGFYRLGSFEAVHRPGPRPEQ